MMDRAEWLEEVRGMAALLYDRIAPLYWVAYGLQPDETHIEYLQKFLDRVKPGCRVLSAACGAGRYDGMLLEAGHSVLGIDQSAGMLARAREFVPGVQYEQMGLQEMGFLEGFGGVICVDALEHVSPEDWPLILEKFHKALEPGGLLYFTVDVDVTVASLEAAYERAKAMGLPVVFGEVVDGLYAAYDRLMSSSEIDPDDDSDPAVYHYHPSLTQVHTWLDEVGFEIEAQGTGVWYEHFLVRKK